MSNVSPDGKWLWDGSQWLPNVTPSPEHHREPAFQAAAGQSGWQAEGDAGHQYQASRPPHGTEGLSGWPSGAPRQPLTPAQELSLAAWSHYGPLAALGVGTLLSLSIVGAPLALLAALAMPGIPLFIRETQGKESRYVHAHATESLNFQLTWLLIGVVVVLLTVITFGLALLLVIPATIFMIVVMLKAGSAAKAGTFYRYPFTLRFVP